MIDHTDPERRLSIDERIATAVSQFERGAMTEAVFRASLHSCGKRENEIADLVRQHGTARPLAEIAKPIIGGFVSGLA